MKKSRFRKTTLYTLILYLTFLIFNSYLYALDVKREVLDNGLTLLMVERHNLPMVIVRVGIKAGSVFEPADKPGLSNLTAELLKSGTKKRTAKEIDGEIEFVGGELEASGGDDYVTISLSVLKKDVNLGFEILSDIIMNPVFPQDEMGKKVNIIKGRLKASEDDPGFVASRVFMKEIFGEHPYSRLVMGSEDGLDRIMREDIIEFHRAYYLSNNSIISVVGDITIDEVKGLIERYFSQWRPMDIRHPDIPIPSIRGKGKTIVIDKDLTQTNIMIGHIGVARNNPDYYAVSIMNYILGGGGFSSRLMQNIRDEKGLVYDINSSYSAKRYGGSFEITLQTRNESAQSAIEEVLKEIKRMRDGMVSDNELEDAKSFLIGSFPMRIETGKRIADFLLAVEYYGLGMDYIDKYPEYIKKVTKDDVQRVAREYLKPDSMVSVLVGKGRPPSDDSIPYN